MVLEQHITGTSPFFFPPQGEDIIAILPWDEWWDFELTKDDSNPHIALLPLHPDMRAKFNETAAWEYALSMNGQPYGYHNMIFSWIDTLDKNYPPPLVLTWYLYSFFLDILIFGCVSDSILDLMFSFQFLSCIYWVIAESNSSLLMFNYHLD